MVLNLILLKQTTLIKVGLPIVILLYKTSCKERKVPLNSTLNTGYQHIYKGHNLMISWFSHCNNNFVQLFASIWKGMGNWYMKNYSHGMAHSLFLRYRKEIINKTVGEKNEIRLLFWWQVCRRRWQSRYIIMVKIEFSWVSYFISYCSRYFSYSRIHSCFRVGI